MKSLKIIKEEEHLKPFVPFNLKLFCTTKKGTKIMYRTLNVDTLYQRHNYLLMSKNGGGISLYQNRNDKISINYFLSTSRAISK